MNHDVNIVTKTEYHVLSLCPCNFCRAERLRRAPQSPAKSPLKHISVDAAYLLGLISRRSLRGSFARELMEVKNST